MMSQFLRTQAIILRRTNYGEADKIINFLTTDGQVSAVARGIRKAGSKLAGALEPFSVVELVLVKTRGQLYRITSANLLTHFDQIIASYERLELGYYLMKIASRLSQDLDGDFWFGLLRQALEALNQPAIDMRLIKAWFNFQSAIIQGEAFNWELTADGQTTTLSEKYSYDIQQKVLLRDPQGRITGDVLKLIKALNVYDLQTVARIKKLEPYLDIALNTSIAHLSLE